MKPSNLLPASRPCATSPAVRSPLALALALAAAGGLLLAPPLAAQVLSDKIVIQVSPTTKRTRQRIAVPDARVLGPSDGVLAQAAREIRDVLRDDLRYSGVFDLVAPELYALAGPTSPESVPYEEWWKKTQASWLALVDLSSKGGELVLEGRLFVIESDRKMVLGKRYQAKLDTARKVAHTFADAIIEVVGGKPGVCTTSIAFVSDRDGGRDREIYVADYDGYAPKRITSNRKLNMSPEWSPDNARIVYTSYLRGNPDLYILSRSGGENRVLFNKPGMNSSPAWSPDGTSIAFSSSHEGGDSEIYTIRPDGTGLKRITTNRGIDTNPAWAPNGRELTFTSDRSGRPDIWQMDADGLNVRRMLTQAGYFNDGAIWSPDGDRIALTAMTGGEFQIFVMTLANGGVIQLTDEGANEAPSWSPDGRQIAYASRRGGRTDVWVMNDDGENPRRITSGGNNLSPAWSHR